MPSIPTDLETSLAAMQLLDSALPTGAFSHSFGFESYLASGDFDDADGFSAWLAAFISSQLTFTDALAIRMIHAAGTYAEVLDLDHRIMALTSPRQIRQASMTIGRRLLTIGVRVRPGPWAIRLHGDAEAGTAFGHQAVAWGVLSRELGLGEEQAVAQHLYATVISLTQNAVRAVPLGQNAGQRAIAGARGAVLAAVERSRDLDPDDLGATVPGLEIAQMRHERQHARLFMS
ncbi:urease accessory protein UreF [Corynebacterium pacaense]|uniref:urease accessory protein UreF n=1 Tax=Corynebacterium pacaense TaxID=1816684 RepID=UPI0009BB9371|nr:urease accessory protein UreF [Corynebacterium pacaense]